MLSAVRRVGITASSKMVRATSRAAFSTGTFADRERGEETRFIRQDEERKRAAEMRAKMEKILAMEDHHEEKQELVSMLEGNKPQETMWTRLQKWNYFVPLGILVGVPALTNEFAVIDMETQILGAFVFTVAAVHNEFGSAIGQTLDDERNDVESAMKKVDDSLLENVHEAKAINENLLDLESDVKSIHTLTDDLAVVQAEYLNSHEEHKYRDAVARKLDALVALEDTAGSAIRARMLNKVHSDVVKVFSTDAKAKDAALAQALSVLSSSSGAGGAKMNKDIVGDYFASSLKAYKDDYAKQAPGSDEIISKLEKDMAVIMQAPEASHSGGNVYDFKTKAAAGGH